MFVLCGGRQHFVYERWTFLILRSSAKQNKTYYKFIYIWWRIHRQ